jgi:hypothetical protein
MMTDFTLSAAKKKALPTTVTVEGSAFEICTSFRTILKIFRMLDDPDVMEWHKGALLCEWLFPKGAPPNWEEIFKWFVGAGEEAGRPQQKKEMDYEFDAPEIYASFLQLYGIDLFETDLHWWQFRALLTGCISCPCALSEKLRLRNLDVSKCADKGAAQRVKNSVQIPASVGTDDMILTQQLQERLVKGEDISDLLR